MKKVEFKQATVFYEQYLNKDNKATIAARLKEIELHKQNIGTDGRVSQMSRMHIRELRKKNNKFRPTKIDAKIVLKKYKATYEIQFEYNPNEISLMKAIRDEIHRYIGVFRKNRNSSMLRIHTSGLRAFEVAGSKKHYVFSKPNQFYDYYVKKKVKDLYKEKSPETDIKYVGLELEFCAPITENDFALKLFKANIHKYAQLKKDGSLRPRDGEQGYELAILMPEASYKKDLKIICAVLKDVKAIAIDRRCGLHVHLDMRRRNKVIVYNNLVACQDVLLSVVDPTRRNNEFCQTVESKKFPNNFTGERTERYKAINAAAYYKYKTLEVRMHHGSIDFKEIANWMDLLIKIGNYRKKMKNYIFQLTTLEKRINLNKRLKEFFQDKRCYWQINSDSGRPEQPVLRPRTGVSALFTTSAVPTGVASIESVPMSIARYDYNSSVSSTLSWATPDVSNEDEGR